MICQINIADQHKHNIQIIFENSIKGMLVTERVVHYFWNIKETLITMIRMLR